MNNVQVGRTEVRVTELGFGGGPIGNLYSAVDDDTARSAIDRAWAGGVRYFDTAPHYGLGLSERRLGEALADRPRAEFTVSTKVGRLLVPNRRPQGTDLDSGFAVPDDVTREFDYSASGVLRSIDESLRRLGLDRIDIVYVHDPEQHMDVALREAIPALVRLREEKVVGAVGVGMGYVAPLLRFVRECDLDVVMMAGRWTPIDRSGGAVLDACAQRGVAVMAAAPFNSGLLASPWPADDATFNYAAPPEPMLRRARELARLARAHDDVVPHVALQFPLRHTAVASVVAGIRNEAEAASALQWVSEPMSPALWQAVDSAVADE